MIILFVSILGAIIFYEIYLRLTWDTKINGVPGMSLPHFTRVEVFKPNYNGWFAGQELKINNLGFRDNEDFEIKKNHNTYRILFLGNSITFGHGESFENTFPELFENRLKKWNSEINWQVWNLGFPGYGANQVLNTIDELGPKYNPDLIIYSFYHNDIQTIDYLKIPKNKILIKLKYFFKKNFYFYSKFRQLYNNFRYGSNNTNNREISIMIEPKNKIYDEELDFGSFEFDDEKFKFKHKNKPNIISNQNKISKYNPSIEFPNNFNNFMSVIKKFKNYNDSKEYKIIVFLNIAPDIKKIKNNKGEEYQFTYGKAFEMNSFYINLFEKLNFFTISPYHSFSHYKPSEVPIAGGHSRAGANSVKAELIFEEFTKKIF